MQKSRIIQKSRIDKSRIASSRKSNFRQQKSRLSNSGNMTFANQAIKINQPQQKIINSVLEQIEKPQSQLGFIEKLKQKAKNLYSKIHKNIAKLFQISKQKFSKIASLPKTVLSKVWKQFKDKKQLVSNIISKIHEKYKSITDTGFIKYITQMTPIGGMIRILKTIAYENIPQFLSTFVFNDLFWQALSNAFPPIIVKSIRGFLNQFVLGNSPPGWKIPTLQDHMKIHGAAGGSQIIHFGALSAANGILSAMGFIDPQKQSVDDPVLNRTGGNMLTNAVGNLVGVKDRQAKKFGAENYQDLKKKIKQKLKNQSQKGWIDWAKDLGFGQFMWGKLINPKQRIVGYGGNTRVDVKADEFFATQMMKQAIQQEYFGANTFAFLQKQVDRKYQQLVQTRRQMALAYPKNYSQQQQIKKDNKTIQQYMLNLENMYEQIRRQIIDLRKFTDDPSTRVQHGFFVRQNLFGKRQQMAIPVMLVPFLKEKLTQIDYDNYAYGQLIKNQHKKVYQSNQQITKNKAAIDQKNANKSIFQSIGQAYDYGTIGKGAQTLGKILMNNTGLLGGVVKSLWG